MEGWDSTGWVGESVLPAAESFPMSVSHYLAMLPEGRNASFPSLGFVGFLLGASLLTFVSLVKWGR